MLEWYAKTHRMSPKDMTAPALRKMKLFTLLSLPAFPFLVSVRSGIVPQEFQLAAMVIGIVSVVFMMILCFSKFCNRFWARDKYLDEWEITRKHQAMAFVFQFNMFVVGGLTLTLLLAAGIFDVSFKIEGIELSPFNLMMTFGAILIASFYVFHGYLLLTAQPIDEESELKPSR